MVLHREQVVGLFLFHEIASRLGLGLEGIGGDHGTFDRQGRQQAVSARI